jgi:hypothetical protein
VTAVSNSLIVMKTGTVGPLRTLSRAYELRLKTLSKNRAFGR